MEREAVTAACSDAERRAARGYARELRRRERRPRVETVWVRPAWAWVWLVLACVGVGASVAAPGAAEVAFAVLAVVALAALVELDGRVPAASLPWPRRATQNVVAPPPGGAVDGRTRVVLAAAYDTPRRADGWLVRLGAGSPALVAAALVALLACVGARVLGAEGTVVGALQLVPTLALLVAAAALLQLALARPARDAAPAPAAALALDALAELDRRPPRRLDVELLLVGAGDARAAGLRARARDADAALVWIEAGGSATAWRRTGPLRFHPDLVAAVDAAGFTRAPGPPPFAAAFARRTRRPTLPLTAASADDVVRLVRALDARL